jgi:hypothetical protein
MNRPHNFRLWFVPLVMAAVAVVQFVAANQTMLSPWKGGGFGMFSTVDSPSARYLRVYLIDNLDETPVLIPDDLAPMASLLRTNPSQSLADQIAAKIASRKWTKFRLSTPARRYEQLLNGGASLHTSDPGDAPAESTERSAQTNMNPNFVVSFDAIDLYRPVDPDEEIPAEAVLPFNQVRLELWGCEFDSDGPRLTGHRLLTGQATNADCACQ